jgi:hypothetical protein
MIAALQNGSADAAQVSAPITQFWRRTTDPRNLLAVRRTAAASAYIGDPANADHVVELLMNDGGLDMGTADGSWRRATHISTRRSTSRLSRPLGPLRRPRNFQGGAITDG